ncbi:hypothetical protein K7A41_05810 [Sphingobacterium sp. InxBP1]|uniref:hypothetical protein n=1 Tax=Sphingobacterium sp. InxBP1 TaxID=2870328 RepID=UPI0022449AA8|nr:hypothetical protein [Sphingobacterium sp. InxBP1]MCW8310729.1 hypothetical protein [Sphingobacterium sp. InxBP1]
MNTLDLKGFSVQEMDVKENGNDQWGLIPLVIFKIAFSAEAVAAGAGAVFLAGMGIGSAVAGGLAGYGLYKALDWDLN